jgi:hypothetical protein
MILNQPAETMTHRTLLSWPLSSRPSVSLNSSRQISQQRETARNIAAGAP